MLEGMLHLTPTAASNSSENPPFQVSTSSVESSTDKGLHDSFPPPKPPCHTTMVELLAGLQDKKRVAFREWQKVLGKLRFIAKAIPGSRGLFCGLQEAANATKGNRVRLTLDLKQHFAMFADLASVTGRPT